MGDLCAKSRLGSGLLNVQFVSARSAHLRFLCLWFCVFPFFRSRGAVPFYFGGATLASFAWPNDLMTVRLR